MELGKQGINKKLQLPRQVTGQLQFEKKTLLWFVGAQFFAGQIISGPVL